MKQPTFPEVLAIALKASGLKQTDLADSIGSSQPHISELLRGKKKPSAPMAKALAVALNADVDGFLLAAGFAPASGRALHSLPDLPGSAEKSMTADEKRIIDAAMRIGGVPSFVRDPSFWRLTPAQRRPTFRTLEAVVEEEERVAELTRKAEADERG